MIVSSVSVLWLSRILECICGTPLYGHPLIIRTLVYSGQFRFSGDKKVIYFLKKLNFFERTKVKSDNVHSSLCLESQTLIYWQPRFIYGHQLSASVQIESCIPSSGFKKNTRNDHEVSQHVPLVPVMITRFHCSDLEHFNNLKKYLKLRQKSHKRGKVAKISRGTKKATLKMLRLQHPQKISVFIRPFQYRNKDFTNFGSREHLP